MGVKLSPQLWADLGLVGICVIWGTSFAIVKTVVVGINPATFITVRFVMAALVIGAMCGGRLRRLDRKVWAAGLLASVPLMAGFLTQTAGLPLTTASKAGFITGMHVVFTPLLDWAFAKRPIARYQMVGVGLAVLGLGLLSIEGLEPPSPGDLLVLLCALAFAVHIVCSRSSVRCTMAFCCPSPRWWALRSWPGLWPMAILCRRPVSAGRCGCR